MVEERSDHMAVSPVVALPSHPQRNPQSLKISPNFHLIDLPFGSIPFIIEKLGFVIPSKLLIMAAGLSLSSFQLGLIWVRFYFAISIFSFSFSLLDFDSV